VPDFPTGNIMAFGYLNEIIISDKTISEIDTFTFNKNRRTNKKIHNE
jgi:hypothetical protein